MGSIPSSFLLAQGEGSVQFSRSVVSDSLQPHGLQPTRLLCPWDFPGKNTGVGCHFLLQGIFLTQGSKSAVSPALAGGFFTTAPPGKPLLTVSSDGKESACNAGCQDLILGLGRCPGEGNGNPLQYSCLENPMDRGAWRAIVHGVAKSRT